MYCRLVVAASEKNIQNMLSTFICSLVALPEFLGLGEGGGGGEHETCMILLTLISSAKI